MSTSKEYMQFVLDQLEGFPDVTYRKMFGLSAGKARPARL